MLFSPEQGGSHPGSPKEAQDNFLLKGKGDPGQTYEKGVLALCKEAEDGGTYLGRMLFSAMGTFTGDMHGLDVRDRAG